eukprot:GHVN01055324.1.p1 GENE.GHVN01055324.1~~GHVN01055324.1.p1  ORF type:complete len:1107 (+),score=73.12 GHVN01055324.1:124-3444(+)
MMCLMSLTILLALPSLAFSQTYENACSTRGLRIMGYRLQDLPNQPTAEDCWEACYEQVQCEGWVWSTVDWKCTFMTRTAGPLKFSIDLDLVSGLRSCDIEGQLCPYYHMQRLPAYGVSDVEVREVPATEVETLFECHIVCRDEGSCNWYNYDMTTGTCTLLLRAGSREQMLKRLSYITSGGYISGHTDCANDAGDGVTCLATPPYYGYLPNGSPDPVQVPAMTKVNYVCKFTAGGETLTPDTRTMQSPQVCQRSGGLTSNTPTCYLPYGWAGMFTDTNYTDSARLLEEKEFLHTMYEWLPVSVARSHTFHGDLPIASVVARTNFFIIPPPKERPYRRTDMWSYRLNQEDLAALRTYVEGGGALILIDDHQDLPWVLFDLPLPTPEFGECKSQTTRADIVFGAEYSTLPNTLDGVASYLPERVATSDATTQLRLFDLGTEEGWIPGMNCGDDRNSASMIFYRVGNGTIMWTGNRVVSDWLLDIWLVGWNGLTENDSKFWTEPGNEWETSLGPDGWTQTVSHAISMVAKFPPFVDTEWTDLPDDLACRARGGKPGGYGVCLSHECEGDSEDCSGSLDSPCCGNGRPCNGINPPCVLGPTNGKKTCTDGLRNGDEEGVDCGGAFCDACKCDFKDGLAIDIEALVDADTVVDLTGLCPWNFPVIVPHYDDNTLPVTCRSTALSDFPINARCVEENTKIGSIDRSIFGPVLLYPHGHMEIIDQGISGPEDIIDYIQVQIPRRESFPPETETSPPVTEEEVDIIIDWVRREGTSAIDMSGGVTKQIGYPHTPHDPSNPHSPEYGQFLNSKIDTEAPSFWELMRKRESPDILIASLENFVSRLPQSLPGREHMDTVDVPSTFIDPLPEDPEEPVSMRLYSPFRECPIESDMCAATLIIISTGEGVIVYMGGKIHELVPPVGTLEETSWSLVDPYFKLIWDFSTLVAKNNTELITTPSPPSSTTRGGISSTTRGVVGSLTPGTVLGIVGGLMGILLLLIVSFVGVKPYHDPQLEAEPYPEDEVANWSEGTDLDDVRAVPLAAVEAQQTQEYDGAMGAAVVESPRTRVQPLESERPAKPARPVPVAVDIEREAPARSPEVTGVDFQQSISTIRSD